MRAALIALFLISAIIHGAASAAASPPPAAPDIDDASCQRYFHKPCNSWIGHWIGQLPIYTTKKSTQESPTKVLDQFIYKGQPSGSYIHSRMPEGTFFAYGAAGPPKGHIVYDSVHHVVFFNQGCCAWGDMVLEAHVPPPPKPLAAGDLSHVATTRGARLGMTVDEAMRLYGRALVTRDGKYERLLYGWMKQDKADAVPCVQQKTLLFLGGALVAILLDNAC
ncbi:MAG TPA: hypothetical protein VGZ02_06865 [Candidatus Baltobacteraceae bacterium]|jgi:hypothetical protein|nr:hypothetical protein [Candidatus Baltobacteraceae bacterium]